jgi:hypothetical protein
MVQKLAMLMPNLTRFVMEKKARDLTPGDVVIGWKNGGKWLWPRLDIAKQPLLAVKHFQKIAATIVELEYINQEISKIKTIEFKTMQLCNDDVYDVI